DALTAVDVSRVAIDLARAEPSPAHVEFEVADIMEYDLHAAGPWDLVVASEMWPYLGWMYSFYFVGWLASEIYAASAPGARLLMVDTISGAEDALLEPWLIATYRDLMVNVGYEREKETRLEGEESGSAYEFLLTVFVKR
ncbi:MAG: class I SAM-dependent methyltransferase, partial [Solirubrobacteraceae bacterium]